VHNLSSSRVEILGGDFCRAVDGMMMLKLGIFK
jgi:hypothetical protein